MCKGTILDKIEAAAKITNGTWKERTRAPERIRTMTTIAEIKEANREAGFFFFQPATMRFFDSRVGRAVYEGPGGIFFLTSEQFHSHVDGTSGPRRWTVREFDPKTGKIRTADSCAFCELSQSEARALAKRLSQGRDE